MEQFNKEQQTEIVERYFNRHKGNIVDEFWSEIGIKRFCFTTTHKKLGKEN